ncbi:E3 ubiquitin-protein ligase UPL5-like [Zingiber officinale]|uniref:E3 ubiquitin-protein ligase UPL5 n=1 Tax=Zingiber officinale TaxID=94328 RepID=A0A8J5G9W3_ZINOF|nr:E3 ubiquitin-protein ligase UPL5-like [Zingiber officinale]KAG6495092.1 hypothetical protein ZIOFF_042883 [Zingiber officinale]
MGRTNSGPKRTSEATPLAPRSRSHLFGLCKNYSLTLLLSSDRKPLPSPPHCAVPSRSGDEIVRLRFPIGLLRRLRILPMSSFDAALHHRQAFDRNHLHHHLKRRIEDYADHDRFIHLLKMAKISSILSFSAVPALSAVADSDQLEVSYLPPSSSLDTSCASPPSPPLASPPSEEIQFFVRLLSQGSLVVRALQSDTVSSIIERIGLVERIPCFEMRLIYRGRQLDGESTLLKCGVGRDACLHLSARLRSTEQPTVWTTVNDLMSSISFLLDNPVRDAEFLNRQRDNIERLMKQFFTSTLLESNGDRDNILANLGIFTWGGASAALLKMYISPIAENHSVGERAIRMFLTSKTDYLPDYMHLQCTSTVLTFCKMLSSVRGTNDQLYLSCRSALARLLKSSAGSVYTGHIKSIHLLPDLHSFIVELVGLVDVALSTEAMMVPEVVLIDLSNYLIALHHAIYNWRGIHQPITKHFFEHGNTKYEEGIGLIHELFMKLLTKVSQCLEKVEDIMDQRGQTQCQSQFAFGSQLLVVLEVVKDFSKIFEGAGQLLHSLLFERRRLLNVLLRHAKRDHRLLWFLKYKDIIDFQARRNLVLMMLFEGKEEDELYEMLIDRSQLMTDSFGYIGRIDAGALRGGLLMEFKNEEATGPGVLREWFCLLCREIFNPQNLLFLPCPHDQRRFFPNPASAVDPLYLKYFSFSGRVIALALMHKVQVGIVFDRTFFLQLAGRSITLEDVRDADPDLYRSWKQILEMDGALLDSDGLGLTFVRDIEMLGSMETVELCPGGKDIIVHSRNREEYINLLIKHRFVTSISEQITHFAEGFGDILSNPKNQQFFFNGLDLEDFDLMIGGDNSVINVKEWREHTEYNGYKSKDRNIIWFWKIVEGMSEEQRRVLIFFWTSIRYLPVDGFRGLPSKLFIFKSSDSQESLPTSHTCFYRLCLPVYRTKTIMHERLQLITQEHLSCSFGNA